MPATGGEVKTRDRIITSELRRHGDDPRHRQMGLSRRPYSSQVTPLRRETRIDVTIPKDPVEPAWEAGAVVEVGRTAEATGVTQYGGAATSGASTILVGARDPGCSPREVEDDKVAPGVQIEDPEAAAGQVSGPHRRMGPRVWRVGPGRKLQDMMGSTVINGAYDHDETKRSTASRKSGTHA